MSRQINFTIGGFFNGYKTIEVVIRGGKASYKILRGGLLDVGKKISPYAEVSAEWLAEFDALNIFAWEENYFNPDILDGTQWDLTVKDGKKIYHGGGSNAYPENFGRFLDWLDVLIPELEFVNRNRIERVTFIYGDETLTLERDAKTLTICKKNSRHVYDAGEEIKNIFDACQEFFDGIDRSDADFEASSRMKFELVRHNGATETFETVCNQNFLPGLTNLLEEIHALASDLTAEIFSPEMIELVPNSGKYIFCKVQFKGSYKHYTYRTDDETLAVGDVVDVPVGRNNDVNQARIVEIGYYDEYEAPFPVERIKKIIGKHIDSAWENY